MKGMFAGTFCPFTNGHLHIAAEAARLCETLTICVADNPDKHPLIPAEVRAEWIRKSTSATPNVEVVTYGGLVADYCREHGIGVLFRGCRSVSGFEEEMNMAATNRLLVPELSTVIIPSPPELSTVSSTLVRLLANESFDVSRFVPEEIAAEVCRMLREATFRRATDTVKSLNGT